MKRIYSSLNIADGRGVMNVFDELPFDCKRFFTIAASKGQVRGGHAHHNTLMILYAISGCVEIEALTADNQEKEELIPNSFGLLLNPHEYRIMNFLDDSTLLILASTNFSQEDYIFEVPQ